MLPGAAPTGPARAAGPEPATGRRIVLLLCSLPGCWMLAAAATGHLGPNPLATLLTVSGRAGLWMLLMTLSMGPLLQGGRALARYRGLNAGRRISDWNAWIEVRRQLGLHACLYSTLHLLIYVGLDVGFDAAAVLDDLRQQLFLPPGWLAGLLLLPLAASSGAAARRWLGVWWARLHLLGYVAAGAAVLHLALQAKVSLLLPWFELALFASLLAWRLNEWRRGRPERLQAVKLRLRRWRGRGEPPA